MAEAAGEGEVLVEVLVVAVELLVAAREEVLEVEEVAAEEGNRVLGEVRRSSL